MDYKALTQEIAYEIRKLDINYREEITGKAHFTRAEYYDRVEYHAWVNLYNEKGELRLMLIPKPTICIRPFDIGYRVTHETYGRREGDSAFAFTKKSAEKKAQKFAKNMLEYICSEHPIEKEEATYVNGLISL